ncbi:MAG: OB-fold domain-containing protein [Sphingomonadaceae bacterium]
MTESTLPDLNDVGAFFWKAGEHGELRIGWCAACERHVHPSLGICPTCLDAGLTDVAMSGRAVVIAITENHQPWLPGHEPPYVIAYLALVDAPHIRLTSNIVEHAPGELAEGIEVQVSFVQRADVWIPEFTPVRPLICHDIAALVPLPDISAVRPRASERKFEDNVAVTGIGMSRIGRRLGATSLELSVEACMAAIDDAGLTRADIDGLCCYPGTTGLPGISSGGMRSVERVMELHPVWHCGANEVPGQAGTVITAMLAVASGLCRHVLCFASSSVSVRPAVNLSGVQARATAELAWQLPFGAASPANWIAMYAAHYLARFGVGREMLGWIAINARRHAADNPKAIYTDPLDMDAYLSARMITSPFGLYDCDVPCDSAFAFIISAADVAPDLRQRPIWVEAVGQQITEHQSWDQGTITHQPNVFGPAAHMWSRTDLKPSNIDVAQLYDGFTFNVVSWLEGLGFCGIGEAAAFVDEGRNITRGGILPLNTHGGHLSAGRSHGYGNIHEAVLQLRGTADARQIEDVKTAAISIGGGIPAGCMLLRT